MAAKCSVLTAGEGAAQIAGRIAFGAAGGDGIPKHLAAIAERAMRGLQRAALFDAPHSRQQFRRRQIRDRTSADPGKYVAFEPGEYPLAMTLDPGFHLLVDPLARNHFEAVRRALHPGGFGGAAVLAGIDAGVQQLPGLDRARAGLLQIDFRVDA